MYVRVISFGTNWWSMRSSDIKDPLCFERRVAYFNAAALLFGRRLRHSAVYPGQIRFNATSGFDPEFPKRAIGKTFLCSGPRRLEGRSHMLFARPASNATPEAYLATLNLSDHGSIQFDQPGWRSLGVLPISISLRAPRYEAMLLIGEKDWIETDLGRWQVDPSKCRLLLSEARKERLQ
jgi:hypothetical protein